MFKLWILLAGLLVLATGTCYLVGGGPFYRFQPVDVQILDYDGEQPLSGAVVSARWYVSSALCIHGECIEGVGAVVESRTDKNGRVQVKPRRRWRKPWLVANPSGPEVIVYKAGYVVASAPDWLHPENGKYFLLSPVAFEDGIAHFGNAVWRARNSTLSSRYAVKLPMLEDEIRQGYARLPARLQREVLKSDPHNAWVLSPAVQPSSP